MECLELGPQVIFRSGTSSSQDDGALGGFEELAIPLFDSAHTFAHRLVQNQNDAEDLVQETYLKALRNFTSFQPGTNFRAWIFQILKNTFLSSCSKLERRMTVAMDSEQDSPILPLTSGTPESMLIERFRIDAIRCAIEQLPVIFREVILLRDVEDASYQEIAETLSIPIGTVMSRLARARKAVRESLRGRSGAPLPRDLSYNAERREKQYRSAPRERTTRAARPDSCNSADLRRASETLKLVQCYAETIHIGVAEDSKDFLAKPPMKTSRRSSKSSRRLNHFANPRGPKECTPKPERAFPF
jgi:RNA polymerase sigma factor (sigma-70 family)